MTKFTDVRVFFVKTGRLKYISHLDLYRTMGRAIKRSSIPVWITEGFNPHIYMTFALPLALGIESEEESVDLRITEAVDLSTLEKRLNSVMPTGLGIIRAAAPVRKASEIHKAHYKVDTAEPETLEKIGEYLSRSEIIITKKTKKNIREIDIKPLLKWEAGESCGFLTLPAGNTMNLNPWNVLSQFDGAGIMGIKRISILCEDGEVFT